MFFIGLCNKGGPVRIKLIQKKTEVISIPAPIAF